MGSSREIAVVGGRQKHADDENHPVALHTLRQGLER